MNPIDRILVTPRWAGTTDSDWYPWLASQLPIVERLALPDPSAPTPERCAQVFAASLAGGDPTRTLIVGHSVSCLGWLHALTRSEVSVAGFLAVAGWWTVDRPWPTLLPWIDSSLPTAALRPRLGTVHVLLGSNDPFTSDQHANGQRWQTELGATTQIIDGAAHFNRAHEPAVLSAVHDLLAG